MKQKQTQKPHIASVIIILAYLIFAMSFTLIHNIPIEITLASVVIVAAIVAMASGFSWSEIEEGIIHGCKIAIIPIIILMTIGVLIASWMVSGIVPSLIYWGLEFLNPQIFLPSVLIICCITSLATGSSWTTIGTVGIALLGVGTSLGISAPMVAGCIVSGAFFGDKMSPLSDSTNLTAAVTEVKLFDHIKSLMWTTIPALFVSLIIYAALSYSGSEKAIKPEEVKITLEVLKSSFHIGWWCLVPPVLVIICAFKKVSALPTLILAVISGVIYAVFIEGYSILEVIYILNNGFKIDTDYERINALLNRGGLQSMMHIIAIAFLGLGLGGIMEKTHMLEILVSKIARFLNSAKTLIPSTLSISWIAAMLLGSQYMAIIIPGRMFLPLYNKLKIDNTVLSRTLEDGGTMISPLVPWGFSGIFVYSTLGIETIKYLPYTFVNLITPIFTVILALTGIGIFYIKDSGKKEVITQKAA